MGEEVALYITRADGKGRPERTRKQEPDRTSVDTQEAVSPPRSNLKPVAPDQHITTKKDTPVYIQLTYNDPDGGPGPYTTTILIHPSYGKLSGIGNDQTYTPVKGYTGTDTITWKVNDGADDAETATIHITIKE
jgi:hypothetical protein